MLPLQGKKILLGVTGSIAAYKSVVLTRLLMKAGAEVRVALTPAVSHFVGPLTFGAITGHAPFQDLWAENWSAHVEMGLWADLMVVAPTSANTLGKMANGLCDNSVLAVFLAAKCPVMVAPAMDRDMYLHPATQRNLRQLRTDGVQVLDTGEGYLASGLEGPGRMMEPELILEAILGKFSPKETAWKGKKLLITAGPTQEALDPVRYISNHSSGKMGYAIARHAARLGADVTLVSGPTALPAPEGVTTVKVVSARDMMEAVQQRADDQDVFILAAAVADYRPEVEEAQKIKKIAGETSLRLVKNPDILAYLGENRRPDQVLIGFALETQNGLANAQEKLLRKKTDAIVLNIHSAAGTGFVHDTNQITFLDKLGGVERFDLKSKEEVAGDILYQIEIRFLVNKPSDSRHES